MLLTETVSAYLERTILAGSSWKLKALLFIIPLSILLNLGLDLRHWVFVKNFIDLVNGHPNPSLCCYFWSDVAYQTTDLFMKKLQVWDTVHQANMRLRLLLPLLWMVFHSALPIYLLQVALGIVQLYMVLGIIHAITQDRVQALYFTWGFSGLYAGAAYYLDFYGYGDALGYAFMTSAIFFRRPVLIGLAIFLAGWVDERSLFNAAFIIIYHWLAPYQSGDRTLTRHALVRPTAQALAAVAGGVVYMAVRLYLIHHYQVKSSIGGPTLFFHVREAAKSIGQRVWSGFESFWLLIVGGLGSMLFRNEYIPFAVISVLLATTTFTVLLAGDFTRTITYGFPIIFVAFSLLRREFESSQMRLILLSISILASIFFPIIY